MYPFWFRHWLGTKCVPSHYQTWWRSLRYKGVTWNFWFYMFWLIEIWIYMAISMTEWKVGISSVLTMEMQHFGTKSSICGRQYFRHRIFNVFICFQVFWQWQNTWNLLKTWPLSINFSYFLAIDKILGYFVHGLCHTFYLEIGGKIYIFNNLLFY